MPSDRPSAKLTRAGAGELSTAATILRDGSHNDTGIQSEGRQPVLSTVSDRN